MASYVEVNVGDRTVLIEIDPTGKGTTSIGNLSEWAQGVAAVTQTIAQALEKAGRAEFEFGVSVTESGKIALVPPDRAAFTVRIPAPPPSVDDLNVPTNKTRL